MRTILLLIAVGIAAPCAAQTTSDLAETTKLSTEDAFTTEQGMTEIEAFVGLGLIDKEFDGGRRRIDRNDIVTTTAVVAVTYGFLETLDARLTGQTLWLAKDDSGELIDELGNITLNAKWRFFRVARQVYGPTGRICFGNRRAPYIMHT